MPKNSQNIQPKILVTNDDGVHAPGIQALAAALDPLGRVTILAPERNWSAAGHPKTLHKPLRIGSVEWADGRAVQMCSGAPSDCVALALLGAVEGPFDLVVSGVNSSFNLGCDVLYSGTVAAAMESLVMGVPSLAVSTGPMEEITVPDEAAWANAAAVTQRLAAALLEAPLPEQTLLNVNVPRLPAAQLRGVQITHLGKRIYRDVLVTRDDPWGRPYYWIGGELPTGIPEEGSDFGAVAAGFVSVTPLGIDLTRQDVLADLLDTRWATGLEPPESQPAAL